VTWASRKASIYDFSQLDDFPHSQLLEEKREDPWISESDDVACLIIPCLFCSRTLPRSKSLKNDRPINSIVCLFQVAMNTSHPKKSQVLNKPTKESFQFT